MVSTPAKVEGQVRTLLVALLHVNEEDVSTETSLEQLGIDSLDIVSLIIALADDLNLDIPDQDVPQITTVGEMIEYVLPAARD